MQLAYSFIDKVFEIVDIGLLACGDKYGIVAEACHPRMLQVVERAVALGGRREVVGVFLLPRVGICLVEHKKHGFVGAAEVGERFVDHFNLFREVGVRHVHDVDKDISLAHLVERAFEGVHEVGGQFADKAHGVGQEERQVVDDDLAHGGVERGEEFVFSKDLSLGEEVDERGLAHIGVAHEGCAYEPPAIFALRGFLPVDVGEALLEERHAVENDAAVHFELRFARAAQTYRTFAAAGARAAALSLEVRPQTLQARQHVTVLRQLHLRLGIGGLGAHGKDIENKARAVENLYFEFALDVA